MKKIIVLLLVSSLTILVSCGKTETTTNEDVKVETPAQEQTETTQTEEVMTEEDAQATIDDILTDEELNAELDAIFNMEGDSTGSVE